MSSLSGVVEADEQARGKCDRCDMIELTLVLLQ
jgi:hypothetical protein